MNLPWMNTLGTHSASLWFTVCFVMYLFSTIPKPAAEQISASFSAAIGKLHLHILLESSLRKHGTRNTYNAEYVREQREPIQLDIQ